MAKVMEQPQRYAISSQEYLRMGEAGVFPPDARLELIEGEIIQMAPIGTAHASTLRALDREFHRRVGDRALVSVQCPVVLTERSLPQPDLALLKPRADGYAAGHPRPADLVLVAEVSDTTLQFDLARKIALYAGAGIVEAWVVDVEKRVVHIFRNPAASGYQSNSTACGDDTLRPAALPDVAISLSLLFPT